jgi:hypothetical protein
VNRHPIRLVVADDLRRSRLTVVFRLLLAIPHLLWFVLFGMVALVIAIVNWFATLIRGTSPQGLHDFLAGYLRYEIHIAAYVCLAANPYPAFFVGSQLAPYPIDLEIDPPARQNRWVTGFRLLLAVPALLVASALAWGGGGGGGRAGWGGPSLGVATVAAVLVWFAALARAQAPRGMRDLIAWCLGYAGQVYGYVFLLTDRYPYSGPEAFVGQLGEARESEGRPRVVVDDDLRRSRLTVFFRLLLAIPHIAWIVGWAILALLAAIANWAATLVLGRSPRPLARFLAAFVRYDVHLSSFLYLVGNPFPGFVGKPGSYPIDLELDPFGPQNRWTVLGRIVLAVPAILLSLAISSVELVVAFLGWFASLARGRMPQGLRNAGAYSIGYGAQVTAYLFVLGDRYPFSGPTHPLYERAAPTGEIAEPAPPPGLEEGR